MNVAELEAKITYITAAIVRDRMALAAATKAMEDAKRTYDKSQAVFHDARRTLETSEEQREAAEKDLAALMAAQEKK
jgi:hypothetical protein